jgi:prophage regulatory protein
MSQRLLRLNEVTSRTGLSRSTIYDMVKKGAFPERVAIGLRSVGWHESAVDDWICARVNKTAQGGENEQY